MQLTYITYITQAPAGVRKLSKGAVRIQACAWAAVSFQGAVRMKELPRSAYVQYGAERITAYVELVVLANGAVRITAARFAQRVGGSLCLTCIAIQ